MSKKLSMTSKEKDIAQRLIRTGLSKNIARSLAFLLRVKETNSMDIEQATGLRQPEVSIAMQALRKMGWVTKRDIKKEGKGRPTHNYRLALPPNKIFKLIEEGENKRIAEVKDNLASLKKLMA